MKKKHEIENNNKKKINVKKSGFLQFLFHG